MILFTILFASLAASQVSAQIQCLTVGQTATATWTTNSGNTCSFTGIVGSSFGTNEVNDGDYSCNGRCGAGCNGTALGNFYTQHCFSHDICSWFNNAANGLLDPNCGSAYAAAIADTLLGGIVGCSQVNPTEPAEPPTTQPTCMAAS